MTNTDYMKLLLLLTLLFPAFAGADSFLVENGESRAEIIIAETPARSTRLAAADLQTYVAKISGAKLPIKTKPSADVPVQIYIGESSARGKTRGYFGWSRTRRLPHRFRRKLARTDRG